MKCGAIIVAAGESRRLGGSTPKIYLPLGGRPMILRTLDKFALSAHVHEIVVVVAPGEIDRCRKLLKGAGLLSERRWSLQDGGATRQQSVRSGLQKLTTECDVVIIHDGARPFVPPSLIDYCARSAFERGAVAAGVPARDTIKVVRQGERIEATLARDNLWEIQTPQGFHRELIENAHERAVRDGFEGTDDAMLLEHMGIPVYITKGARLNFKITVPEDIWLAEALIRDGRVS